MKKFMFYLMVLNTFFSAIAMIVLIAMGSSSLPVLVFILRGVLVAGGTALVVKKYVSWVRRGEIGVYYALEAAVAVFNLAYLSLFFPVSVPIYEFLITGTLVTPFLNGVLILMLFKMNGRYAVLENPGEPETAASPRQVAHGQAVKQN